MTGVCSARAVLFFSTADPEHNTGEPQGEFADSGWDLQGRFGNFLGTPIAPRYFITAGHVGGQVGDVFKLNGEEYPTTARFDDPDSDLRIWRICGQFPETASLYEQPDETGQTVVVYGRGTQRGETVEVEDLLGNELKGWRWGEADHRLRWGVNQVDQIVSGGSITPLLGNSESGELLRMRFEEGNESNEAHLSSGDSGGAVFIQADDEWKLAGINYAVDGPYNTRSTGAGFQAAVFDEGDLYKGGEENWQQEPDLPVNQSGGFYATRISPRIDWIQSILSKPESDFAPQLQAAGQPEGTYEDVEDSQWQSAEQAFEVPLEEAMQFFRIEHCHSVTIREVRVTGETVQINYQ